MPLIFGIILLAAVGAGTLLAALNVSYRDFRYVRGRRHHRPQRGR